jgi:hypothetical protein
VLAVEEVAAEVSECDDPDSGDKNLTFSHQRFQNI